MIRPQLSSVSSTNSQEQTLQPHNYAMKTSKRFTRLLAGITPLAALLAASTALVSPTVQAAPIAKSAAGTDLTAGASWSGSVAPASSDVAVWDTSSLGAGLTLNSGTPSWLGITVNAGATDPVNIGSGGTLTVGTSGINLSASTINATFGCNISLASGYQAWAVASGKTLAVNGTLSRAAGASMSFPTAGVTSTTLANDSTGILGGWATVTGTGDWAANNGSGSMITYASYTSVGANFAPSATANYKNTATAGPSASGTVNSFNAQFDFPCSTFTITNASGGIILGSTERWVSGTGATIKSGLASGELFIHANTANFANGFQIQPIIADNGSTPGIVIKDGSGQCEMGNGANTFSGGFYLNAGSVYLGGSSTGLGAAVTSGPLGKGTVTLNAGSLFLYGRNNGSSSVFAGFTMNNNVVIPSGSSPTINNGGLTGTLNGNVSGGGSINFAGAGTTVFEGTNSYSGTTTISAGTVGVANNVGTNVNFGPGAVSVSGGTLRLGYAVTSNANKNYTTNNITLAGTIYEDDAFQHLAGPINVTGASTLGSTYNGGGADADKGLYVDGVVSGSSALTVQISHYDSAHNYDTCYVVFTNNANTYSGTITVNENSATTEGGVYVGVNGSLALSNATLATAAIPGATLRFGTSPIVFKTGLGSATLGAISGSGPLVLAGYDAVNHTYTGGGSIALTVGGNNSTTTYSGAISGANGSLTKAGSGTLTLSGANTYTGPTTVGAGSLFLTSPLNSIGSVTMNSAATLADTGTNNGDVYLVSGAVLVPGGSNTVGTLTIITNSPTALTLNGNAIAVDLSSTNGISDLIALTGASGTLVLNGANTISLSFPNGSAPAGTYTLMTYAAKTGSGTLALDHAYPNANATLTVGATSVTLTIGTGGTSGSFVWKGDGTANAWDTSTANWLSAGATTPVTTYIDTYFSVLFDNTGSNTPAVNITPSSVSPLSVTVNSTNNYTIGGAAITGPAPLTKSGSGTLTLNGNNSFSGASTISGGTVIAGSATALGTTAGGVTLSGGSTLDMQTDGGDNAYNISIGSGNTVAVNSDVKTGSVGINHTLGALALGNSTLNLNKGPNVASGSPAITFGAVNLSAGVAGTAIINPTNVGVTLASASIALNSSAKTLQLDGASANNSVAGVIADGLNTVSLTKANTGTWTLSGANTYTGTTTVSGGTLNYSGTLGISPATAAAQINVGVAGGGNATLNIQSGANIRMNNTSLLAGNGITAPVGDGFVFQSGSSAITGINQLQLGAGASGASYGYYNLSGSASVSLGELDLGSFNGAAVGVLDMSGGTINVTNWFVPSRGTAAIGILNMTGGAFNYYGPAAQFQANWNANAGSVAVLNIANASLIASNANVSMMQTGTAGKLGEINLLSGGLLQANSIAPGSATGNSLVNFNGGTLKANTANATFVTANNTAVNVYGGGGTIDNNGIAITIPKALLAPAGSGINSAVSFTGGSGYVGAPAVTLSGGGGTGAAGYATISGGAVTGIVITSPGYGYTSVPTIALTGGGYTSAATATAPTPTANTSGGMRFQGSGTTTLTGANNYTGNTVIGAGTLTLSGSGALASGNIIVSNNATFDVSAVTGGFTLGASQSLFGGGMNNGPISTVSGSKIYAGLDGSYATNTFNNTLTLVPGAVVYFDLGTNSSTGANDLVNVNGNVVDNGAVHISAPNTSVNLDTNNDYVLLTASGGLAGSVSATPLWGTKPLNWRNFTVLINGNNLQLHYTASTPPVATGAASPATVTRNQSTLISVTVTPGTGAIDPNTGVTLDASPVGLSSSVPLVLSSVANVYTNTLIMPAALSIGSYTLNATITDSTPLTGSVGVGLTVVVTNQLWNGAGPDAFADDNANWSSGWAPGYIGDSMTFAGIVNLNPDLDQAYTVSGLTFNTNAGSFTLGSTANYPLTLSANGPIAVYSTNAQTLNLVLADSGGGLTKSGNGTLVLTANNTFTGLTSVQGGGLVVGSGTLGIAGAGGANIEIAPNSNQVASVTVSNGTVNAVRVIIGGSSGNNTVPGTGVVNQVGGTINSYNWFTVGSGGTSNGVGTFNLSGGIVNVEHQQMEVGNFTNASGTVNMSGSSALNIWNNNALTLGANNNATSGTFNQDGGTVTLYSDGGSTAGGTGFLALGRAAVSTGIFTYNLFGGTLTVPQITHVSGTGNFYFNGGTLQASKDNTAFMTGLSAAYVSTNGAVIDDGGHAVTIGQPLIHDPALGGAADAGLTKQNTGTLMLDGTGTYTGNTTISGGTLKLAAPVLHLSFDNVSGTTVVNDGGSGSTMNGTLTGTASIVSGGRFGNALQINGTAKNAGYVLITGSGGPTMNVAAGAGWTVAYWLKTTTPGAITMYQGNGAWNNTGGADTLVYCGSGNPETLLASTNIGIVSYGRNWERGTANITDGNWHFVVMTCNGTTKVNYVDGVLDALQENDLAGTAKGNQIWIGGCPTAVGDAVQGLNGGLMDEFSMFNRALSQDEIQALYNNNAAPVLPNNTTVSVASGATFDVGGIKQQIAALTGSGSVILGDNAGVIGNLTLGNGSDMAFDGSISDSGVSTVTKVGSGTLTLTGANSYAGTTTVSNGTLIVVGSHSGPVTVTAGGKLAGLGTLYGAVTVNGNLAPGSNSIAGTLTINNNLTIAAGGKCTFSLSDTYNSGNDQIAMGGGLLANNNLGSIVHIKTLGAGHSLDVNDYVLISGVGSLSGVFAPTLVWDVQPDNYTNYTVLVSGGQVLLHYSATTAPSAGITLNPATVSRNQSTLITVTATNGYYPVSTVTVDVSAINSPASPLSLFQVGASDVWTNTIAVVNGTAPNTYTLVATITDSGSQTVNVGANLTVTLGNDIWTGIGSDDNWSTNPNWIHSAAPDFFGDSLVFAGSTRLTPYMDNNYSVSSVTFSNNAGSFNISGNGSTLTLLTNGVVNNSTNAQTLGVPVVLGAAQTLNAAAGNLTLSQTVNNGGYLLTVAGASNTVVSGDISGSGGLTKTGNGTLDLTVANSYTGATTVSGGTLALTGNGAISSTTSPFLIGTVAGTPAAVYQSGASTLATAISGGGGWQLGSVPGASGYYNLSAGTITIPNGGELDPAGSGGGAGTFGRFDMSGGAVNVGVSGTGASYFLPCRGNSGESSVVNLSGGTLAILNGMIDGQYDGYGANWAAGSQTNVTTISGSALFQSLTVSVKLNWANNATNVGILNLNGGTWQMLGLKNNQNLNVLANFNGGTVKAGNSANAAFLGNCASACVYAGGGTVDNNGQAITITQPIVAPAGNGIATIPVLGGVSGAGYVIPPQVMITDTTGSNATAYAQISGGAVTNIVVTCPGNNYSPTPTVTLVGGGYASAASLGTVTTAANTGGGLTASGTGVLTLTGTNTYAGATVVNNGTLQITDEMQLGAVPGSAATNITLNAGELYNNNSTPVLSATRTILLGASGGYLQGGWGPQGRSFVVNGLITGMGGLGINWDAAPVYLNAVNNYHGDTTIGSAFGTWWNNVAANPTLALGIDNALPYGTGFGNVVFGTTTNANTATLNLNGHNAQINGLTGNTNAIIDNTIAGSYVLTVGNNNGGGIFAGVIKNTAGTVALIKTGSGSVTNSGANSYTGNTTVNGGILSITQARLATNSTVTVASGAILNLGFSETNTVASLVLNGVTQPPGVYNSTTAPTYITGAGSLIVPSTGPGIFTSTPGITSFALVGANVLITGTNGQSGDAYYLLTSTNLTLPLNQWWTVATNVLSANGSFTFNGTNVVTFGYPQQFYILSNTNYNH